MVVNGSVDTALKLRGLTEEFQRHGIVRYDVQLTQSVVSVLMAK